MTPVAEVSAEPHALNRDAVNSERVLIAAVGAMVVIQLWFGLIGTSFWLDETGTWWIVKDGAAEAVRRSFSWSGQSPLYYLTAWLSSRLFGLNEIALRLPSVLAMSGAVYFFHRIAERLFDRSTAAVAAFVFLCSVSFYAIDARPYALAMLFLTGSTWALLRWLDTNRPEDATLYVAMAALLVYAHCVMSLGLLPGFVYAVVRVRNERRRLIAMGLFGVSIALLSIPLVPELRTFYAGRSAHTFTAPPALDDLLPGLIPGALTGASILLVWTCMAFRSETRSEGKCAGSSALLIGTWSLFAPVFLFLLAALTDLRLYVPKYYSSALPGQALLAGGLLASIRRSAVRKALIVAAGALAILNYGRFTFESHGREDWRTAMTFLKSEAGRAPVLLVSGFVEGADFAALKNPRLRDVLFAPELMYGEPERSLRMPNTFNVRDDREREAVARQLEGESRFYLLTENPDRSYEMWLLGRLGSGCRAESTGTRFGYIWITRFTCENRS